MKKMYITVEDSRGHVLGKAETSKERVIIGSGANATVRINDEKLAAIENEIYILNGECWVQVSKEGSAIGFKGKQFRTIKLEENSTLYFKHLVLKVSYDKPLEADQEKTRVVSSQEARPVEKNEHNDKGNLEMTLAGIELNEKTRVVSSDIEKTRIVAPIPPQAEAIPLDTEKTRVITPQAIKIDVASTDVEKTRVLTTDYESTRIVTSENEVTKVQMTPSWADSEKESPRTASVTEEDIYGTDPSTFPFNLKEFLSSKNITIKEVSLIAFCAVVGLLVIQWLFLGSKTSSENLDQLAQEQQSKLSTVISKREAKPEMVPAKLPEDTSETTPITREEYLRSLSSLFDKH